MQALSVMCDCVRRRGNQTYVETGYGGSVYQDLTGVAIVVVVVVVAVLVVVVVVVVVIVVSYLNNNVNIKIIVFNDIYLYYLLLSLQ